MLDIKFIRENKELIEMAAKKKRLDFKVDELLKIDDKRKELLLSIEAKRAEQNSQNEKIAKADSVLRDRLIKEMQAVKSALSDEEATFKEVMAKWQRLMLAVPNVPDISVPDGKDDSENREVRVWGDVPHFAFKPKDHIALMEKLGMIDLERGADVAGFRGYFLKGAGAMLEFAISQLAVEHFVGECGLEPMIVPSMVKRETLLGTGYLPQGEEDLYKTQDGEYLAGTGEVAMMSYFAGAVLKKEELPKKVLAYSPCFRREAGSHGKDVKGIYRVHEFRKFEQVVLCEASHEASVKLHEEITENSEKFLQKLKLPHHVVINCGGDLGLGQVKKYDIECWCPSQNKYRETHSSSYFHDFQTRRLNIKYKDETGKARFAHSLNNTAVALPRVLISIVENYQQEDGTIAVPEVLQKMVGRKYIGK